MGLRAHIIASFFPRCFLERGGIMSSCELYLSVYLSRRMVGCIVCFIVSIWHLTYIVCLLTQGVAIVFLLCYYRLVCRSSFFFHALLSCKQILMRLPQTSQVPPCYRFFRRVVSQCMFHYLLVTMDLDTSAPYQIPIHSYIHTQKLQFGFFFF